MKKRKPPSSACGPLFRQNSRNDAKISPPLSSHGGYQAGFQPLCENQVFLQHIHPEIRAVIEDEKIATANVLAARLKELGKVLESNPASYPE